MEKMKNKKIVITAVLLMFFSLTCFRMISDGSIRTVEFLSIFSIGALTGILLTQIFEKVFDKK
jgi:hypothetical protein